MKNDSKERNNWKVRIVNSINKVSNLITKPQRKLMNEFIFGILSSGSVQISKICRTLKEPTRLHHTMKRLSRMLGKHGHIAWEAEDLLLNKIVPQLTDDMVVGIDPGDLNRNGSTKSENICKIRDGDKGTIVNGYPLITVVARCLKTQLTLPLLTRLLSSTTASYKSENNDIMQSMTRVRAYFKDKINPLWVIDRGGDRSKLWDFWIENDFRICVRAANLRYWTYSKGFGTAQQIAKRLPLKHYGKLKKSSKNTVKFGITKVCLKEHPNKVLYMVVVRHGKQQPLVLVTTDKVRGRLQGEKLIQSYMSRWACEEGFRFCKQGFDLEGVQARKLNVLQNLVALSTFAWAILASHQQDGGLLIDKARRQKPKHKLTFPYYTLLSGLQALFVDAKMIFYDWWRKPKTDIQPIMGDLFANTYQLLPVLGKIE